MLFEQECSVQGREGPHHSGSAHGELTVMILAKDPNFFTSDFSEGKAQKRQSTETVTLCHQFPETYSIAVGTNDQLMDAIPGSMERRKVIFSINSFCLPRVDTSALSRVRSLPGSLSL